MVERGAARRRLSHRPLHVAASRRHRGALRHRRRADRGGGVRAARRPRRDVRRDSLAAPAQLLRSDHRRGARCCFARRGSMSPCSRSVWAAGSTRPTSSTPVAAAITAIDFDHEAFLGHTLEADRAREGRRHQAGTRSWCWAETPGRAGVVRRRVRTAAGADMSTRPTSVDVDVIMDERPRRGCRSSRRAARTATCARPARPPSGRQRPDGLRLLEELSAHGLAPVPADAIRTGVEDVVWPARLELLALARHEDAASTARTTRPARARSRPTSQETYGRSCRWWSA